MIKLCPLKFATPHSRVKDDVGKNCRKDCAWWDDHPDRQQCAIVSLVHLIGIEDELGMTRKGYDD